MRPSAVSGDVDLSKCAPGVAYAWNRVFEFYNLASDMDFPIDEDGWVTFPCGCVQSMTVTSLYINYRMCKEGHG